MNICGKCKKQFETEKDYLKHKCVTGFTPQDIGHFGKWFERISARAIERGNKRKK